MILNRVVTGSFRNLQISYHASRIVCTSTPVEDGTRSADRSESDARRVRGDGLNALSLTLVNILFVLNEWSGLLS